MDATTPLRVLVIEQDTGAAERALDVLKQDGLEVDSDIVATRAEFASVMPSRAYDIVLSAYQLPDWSGMDALEALRATGTHVPFILVTGLLGDERAADCLRQGATDYVLKDNLVRLPTVVRRALDEWRARRELAQADSEARSLARSVRDRDEQLEEMADHIRVVFFVIDADFREIRYVNRAYAQVWGRSRASLIANPRSFLEAVDPGDAGIVTEYIARVQRGETPGEIEFRVVHPDGSIRWLQAHAVPIRDDAGGVYRLSGVVQDITERRASRTATIESESLFRKLTEASFDGISIMQEGVIAKANEGFLRIFGYASADEVVGRSVLHFVAEESREIVAHRIAAADEGTYEFIGRRKNGAKVVIEATARTHIVDGRPGRITALRDLTAQRALEAQFRQAQKMEAMGRLAGGVAHDFNNLLTVISSYAEILADSVTENDPRHAELREIISAAHTAAGLTRQLLAFSRQQIIQPRIIALEDTAVAMKKMLSRVIGEDVALETALSATPLMVNIDPGQLENVIMNLAINARDAMPTGGKLTIETARKDLDERFANAHWPVTTGTYAMLAVSDNGIGMDEKTRAQIFEPFFTTKEVGKGTGLGLATVYGVVKQNGGFIWVYSEPGRGTTFKIYLPLVNARSDQASPETALANMRGGAETVLVVEDEEAVRGVIQQILTGLGYRVFTAKDGFAAMDVASHAEHLDLVLTDVVMPGISGRELVEQMRTVNITPRVLYMSGYTDDSAFRHGVLTAAVAFLQKPFTPAGLAAKVREVLDA